MNLLFDLDCLSKLNACSAFEDALAIFPDTEKQCFYADTFPYSAEKIAIRHEKANHRYMASVFHKIADRSLLSGFNVLKANLADLPKLAQLRSIHNIDEGEALLLLNTFRMDNSLLLTGDGRFLTAVTENEQEIKKIIPNFDKKFIFFLNIVEKICKNDPVKISLFKSEQAFESDKALKAIFGGEPTIDSISDAIISYTADFSSITFPLDLPKM